MLNIRIDNWLTEFKKRLVTYHDGFFDLPYLSNTPAVIIEEFKHIPFTKYLEKENEIHIDNIFADGLMCYRELEEGLWVIITEMEFKKNLSTSALYDNEPCDYYFLSHFIYSKRGNVNDATAHMLGWRLYKPGVEIKTCFNKGDKGVFATFAFNKSWLEHNILTTDFAENQNFLIFFETESAYMTWGNVLPGSELLIREIIDLIKHEKRAQHGILPVKILCLQTVLDFFTATTTDHPIKEQIKLRDSDRCMVAKAEKILTDNLTIAFPGINAIAQALNTSPTKLRTIFRKVHQTSIFQYYQKKQMSLALQMLKANHTSVKEVALTFKYRNSSKFSAAFKKHHNILPSEV